MPGRTRGGTRTAGEKKKEEPVVTKPAVPPPSKNVKSWDFTSAQLLAHFTPGKTPRPQQTYFLERAAAAYAAGKRVVVGELPTGAGKTDACKTIANALRSVGESTFMLTSQKILQDQYATDYPAPDIETLKGRANYACTHEAAEPDQDAADGVCRRKSKGILGECVDEAEARPIAAAAQVSVLQAAVGLGLTPSCHRCPYWAQLQRVHDASISLFNFSSFLFQQRIGRFPKRALMIVDEAHNCESQLMNYVTLELSEWALSLVGVKITRDIRTKAEFLDWLAETDLVAEIARKIKAVEGDDADEKEGDDLNAAELDALKELDGKLANFMAFLEKTEWILEVVKYNDKRTGDERKKIVARPLYAKDFAQDLLFRHADRLCFMSATILDVDVWARNLGLSMDEVELVRTPCDFPVENRPIYKDYCGNFGFRYFTKEQNPKDPTEPKFVRKVAEILDRHEGQRGIIHCHSFSLSKILYNGVETDRFLFQDHFDSKEAMLAEHARRTDSVIVAPAMHEGLDLKGDLSRFQVIAKMPWPNMQDRVIKQRMDRDQAWYSWLCALKIVQSYGRSVRSRDDWATTYLLDAGFESFLWKNARMLPDWFHEALRKGVPKEVRR
jgi:Rad3-related DNA helicase